MEFYITHVIKIFQGVGRQNRLFKFNATPSMNDLARDQKTSLEHLFPKSLACIDRTVSGISFQAILFNLYSEPFS